MAGEISNRLSPGVEKAVREAARDGVITRTELEKAFTRVTWTAETLTDFGGLRGAMTPRAVDVYEAVKKAALDLNGEGRRVLPNTPSVGALPDWFPLEFDLQRASAGVRQVLESQGADPRSIGPGLCDRVVFTDADHTLLDTRTSVYLKHKGTGERLIDPTTGKPLALGREFERELAAAKGRLTEVPWHLYEPDFSEFLVDGEVVRTPLIAETVSKLEDADRNARSREFVITARNSETAGAELMASLALHGVNIQGVFAVNSDTLQNSLAIPKGLTSAQKKALVMAAILLTYDPEQSRIRRVSFMEDGDANLVAAMQLLPKLFPGIRFEFVDVVNVGHEFRHVEVARTHPDGELVGPEGRALSLREIDGYSSPDAPPLPETRGDGA